MLVYFSGADRPNTIKTLAQAGGTHVLISYAEKPSSTCWKLYAAYGFSLLADSGAYSIMRRGISLDINEYMAWLRKYSIADYFNLDVIGNPDATAFNQAYMEASGFNPIPVFHIGESWTILDDMAKRYQWIGLGGLVPASLSAKRDFLREVFKRHPDKSFHALGVSRASLLTEFSGLASIDSTWWLCKQRTKVKRLAPDGSHKDEQIARIRYTITNFVTKGD